MSENTFYDNMVGRNIGLLSQEQQKKLKESSVAVFGLGGLGGVAAELVVRCGVGTVKISDIDVFETSNLNRQIFAFTSTLNQPKVDATERFLKDINPELKVEKYGVTNEVSINQMLNSVDVAIMCIDKVQPAIHVARVCRKRNIPMIESVAVPYANLRTYTKDTMTYEEFNGLPTAGKSMEELYALDEEAMTRIRTAWIKTFSNIEGITGFYNAEVVERFKKGKFSTFGPLVWMSACLTAMEAVKVILNWGTLSTPPNYAVYDPFKYKIPKKIWPWLWKLLLPIVVRTK